MCVHMEICVEVRDNLRELVLFFLLCEIPGFNSSLQKSQAQQHILVLLVQENKDIWAWKLPILSLVSELQV